MQTIPISGRASALAGLVRDALADPRATAALEAAGLAGPMKDHIASFAASERSSDSGPCPYEVAARAAGYVKKGDCGGVIYHVDDFDSWKSAVSWGNEPGQPPTYDTWQECCEAEGIAIQGTAPAKAT